MRHLLLAALLVGTTLGQGKTLQVTEKPPIDLPPIPQSAEQPQEFDPNAPQVCVEVRFVSGSPEAMKQLMTGDLIRTPPAAKRPEPPAMSDAQLRANNGIQLASATRVVEEQQPVFVRRLNDKQAFRLLQIGQNDERVNVLFAPKVTVVDGQTAEIKDAIQRPFVVGLLSKTVNELKPKIEVVDEGESIQIRATKKPEGVRLDLAIDLSQIASVSTKNAGPEGAIIQVPRISASRARLSALVTDGGTLAIAGLQRTVEVRKEKKVLGVFRNSSVGRGVENIIILVTPRIILPENQTGKETLSNHVSQAQRSR